VKEEGRGEESRRVHRREEKSRGERRRESSMAR
jgi:hypothetical protein